MEKAQDGFLQATETEEGIPQVMESNGAVKVKDIHGWSPAQLPALILELRRGESLDHCASRKMETIQVVWGGDL